MVSSRNRFEKVFGRGRDGELLFYLNGLHFRPVILPDDEAQNRVRDKIFLNRCISGLILCIVVFSIATLLNTGEHLWPFLIVAGGMFLHSVVSCLLFMRELLTFPKYFRRLTFSQRIEHLGRKCRESDFLFGGPVSFFFAAVVSVFVWLHHDWGVKLGLLLVVVGLVYNGLTFVKAAEFKRRLIHSGGSSKD